MKEREPFDFWYAVNNTEVIHMPARHLETFGTTMLNYHLVSEFMDSTSQIRVREGRMQANQPKIVTPEAYSEVLLEGFGEQASRYVEWLKEHEKNVRILQYGYTLKQESFSEHIISDNVQAVLKRVEEEVKAKGDPLSAVVRGVDDPWDVCLVKLFWEIIQESSSTNVRQLEKRHLFDDPASRMRRDIERAFLAASKNPALIRTLGKKLQDFGVFEDYQDRFFALLKASAK